MEEYEKLLKETEELFEKIKNLDSKEDKIKSKEEFIEKTTKNLKSDEVDTIIVITNMGHGTLGYGIDVLSAIGAFLVDLKQSKFPDDDFWKDFFNTIMEESKANRKSKKDYLEDIYEKMKKLSEE